MSCLHGLYLERSLLGRDIHIELFHVVWASDRRLCNLAAAADQ